MSSDSATAGTVPRFRRTTAVVVTALLVVVAALTVANSVQGPRLARAQFDPHAAVDRAGQRLTLRLDQAVDLVPGSPVEVRPAAPVAVTVEQATVAVRFTAALPYATRYVVLVPVRSTVTGATSTLHYSFATPDPVLYTRQRAVDGSGGLDAILRTAGGVTEAEPVAAASRIAAFAVAEPNLAVVTDDDHGTSTIDVRPVDGSTLPRQLVTDAHVDQLKSSGPGGVFGFVVTTETASSEVNPVRLELYQPGSTSGPTPVLGLDEAPLQVLDWDFVPGTTSIVVQDTKSAMFLFDPVDHAPVKPLGTHRTLHGFGRGTTLVVEDADGEFTAIDLTSGRATALPVLDPRGGLVSQLVPLAAQGSYLGLVATLKGHTLQSSVVTVRGRSVQTLYRADSETTVQRLCLSANGQEVAVATTTPHDHTLVLDATGRPTNDVPGDEPSWCTN